MGYSYFWRHDMNKKDKTVKSKSKKQNGSNDEPIPPLYLTLFYKIWMNIYIGECLIEYFDSISCLWFLSKQFFQNHNDWLHSFLLS